MPLLARIIGSFLVAEGLLHARRPASKHLQGRGARSAQLRALQATTAEAALVHTTKAAPSDADLLVREGVALEGRGEALDALDCYEAALELDPASWEACFRLGSLNVAHGLVEEAAELFERALELNPAHDTSAQCLAALTNSLNDGKGYIELLQFEDTVSSMPSLSSSRNFSSGRVGSSPHMTDTDVYRSASVQSM